MRWIQPLTAIVAYGHAAIEWLSAKPPNVEEARRAANRVIEDGTRAGAVLHRIRALSRKESRFEALGQHQRLVSEFRFLSRRSGASGVSIRTELARMLPQVLGDHVQLEQ